MGKGRTNAVSARGRGLVEPLSLYGEDRFIVFIQMEGVLLPVNLAYPVLISVEEFVSFVCLLQKQLYCEYAENFDCNKS